MFPVPSPCFVAFLQSLSLSLQCLCYFLAAPMYRAPVRPQRSPGAPRPTERYPSPASCWGFPGARSPYGGSARGGPAYSPDSLVQSPGFNRGYRDCSPSGFGSGARGFGDSPPRFCSGPRGFGDSPSGFGSGPRGFGGQRRPRGGFRWAQSFSPSAHNVRGESSVEKYFSPSMLQDPWEALQPAADAHSDRQMS
ncbi:uncharacterized protein PEZ65_009261 [Lycodopsis pacificus]